MLINSNVSQYTATFKVSKGAKIRSRYNQVPHPTQDTNGKVTNSQFISHFSDQRRLRRVCALSQTRLSFKIQEISKFHIISHLSDQGRLRRVCALSQTRLSFKIREISNFHIIYHFSDQPRRLRRVCALSQT